MDRRAYLLAVRTVPAVLFFPRLILLQLVKPFHGFFNRFVEGLGRLQRTIHRVVASEHGRLWPHTPLPDTTRPAVRTAGVHTVPPHTRRVGSLGTAVDLQSCDLCLVVCATSSVLCSTS